MYAYFTLYIVSCGKKFDKLLTLFNYITCIVKYERKICKIMFLTLELNNYNRILLKTFVYEFATIKGT